MDQCPQVQDSGIAPIIVFILKATLKLYKEFPRGQGSESIV